MSYGGDKKNVIRSSCKTSRGCNEIHVVDGIQEKLALRVLPEILLQIFSNVNLMASEQDKECVEAKAK